MLPAENSRIFIRSQRYSDVDERWKFWTCDSIGAENSSNILESNTSQDRSGSFPSPFRVDFDLKLNNPTVPSIGRGDFRR